jgi:hypothetical protein
VQCFREEQQWPIDVPAHGDVAVLFQLWLHRAGPFEESFGLFVADDALRILPVTIRGTATHSDNAK